MADRPCAGNFGGGRLGVLSRSRGRLSIPTCRDHLGCASKEHGFVAKFSARQQPVAEQTATTSEVTGSAEHETAQTDSVQARPIAGQLIRKMKVTSRRWFRQLG